MAETTKPFDLSGKELLEMDPAAFAALAGIAVPPGAEVTTVDADLSSVTAAADKLIRIGIGAAAFLIEVEFQSTWDRHLAERAALYAALARYRHHLPVRTVVILYRPEAAPGVTGLLVEGTWLRFEYTVVRPWEVPAERLLTGPLTLVPIAPVAAVPAGQVQAVLDRAKARFLAEAPPDRAGVLGGITGLLLGLYFGSNQVEAMMGTFAQTLEDSSVYKALIRKGEARGEAKGKAEGLVEGAQDVLLRAAERRFGPPPATAVGRVRATTSVDALTDMVGRVPTATGWDDLFAAE